MVGGGGRWGSNGPIFHLPPTTYHPSPASPRPKLLRAMVYPVADTPKIEVVALPGLDGTGLLFADFVRSCPAAFAVRVMEYPRDRFLGYRELLPLVRDRLPTRSEFVILGESFSGPLAVMLAAERPPGLRAVVLAATFVRRPRPLWVGVLPWRLLLRLKSPGLLFRWLLAGARPRRPCCGNSARSDAPSPPTSWPLGSARS